MQSSVEFYGEQFWQEMFSTNTKPLEERKEDIQDELDSLAHKDRLDDADKSRMAELKHLLERWKWDRKEEEEKQKNIYFELAMQVNRLIKPNGRWQSGDTKRWSELRDEVVDFILKRKIKEERENG